MGCLRSCGCPIPAVPEVRLDGAGGSPSWWEMSLIVAGLALGGL